MKAVTVAVFALMFGATVANAQSVNGTVKKVDIEQGKVTLDHGPIKNLDMDSMTMVFRVASPDMLKGLKAGDKIKFDADRVNGAITVTNLKK
ncbi:MAG: copper-binding protein [Proteobacteria bacterium]|nr:copper-binding protein [Pseudomonadota bacterium]